MASTQAKGQTEKEYADSKGLYAREGGFSRTDALGLILNRVFDQVNKENLREILVQSKLLGHLIYSLFKILGFIPISLRTKLGYKIGYLIAMLPSSAIRITILQIRHFLNPKNPLQVARQCFAQAGSTSFECFDLSTMIKNPENYFSVRNPEELERILVQKKGIVALTAHFGNFDSMGAYFATKKIKLMAVAKQLRNPALQIALERLRNSYGYTTVWRADKSGLKRILQALKDGWVVASLVDHDTRVSSSMIPFFGLSASTPKTLVEIAKKQEALIVSAFVVRKETTKFEIVVEEIPSQLTADEILTIFNARLEQVVKLHPEQWSWMHKRWRSVGGKRLGGKEYYKYLQNLSGARDV